MPVYAQGGGVEVVNWELASPRASSRCSRPSTISRFHVCKEKRAKVIIECMISISMSEVTPEAPMIDDTNTRNTSCYPRICNPVRLNDAPKNWQSNASVMDPYHQMYST